MSTYSNGKRKIKNPLDGLTDDIRNNRTFIISLTPYFASLRSS